MWTPDRGGRYQGNLNYFIIIICQQFSVSTITSQIAPYACQYMHNVDTRQRRQIYTRGILIYSYHLPAIFCFYNDNFNTMAAHVQCGHQWSRENPRESSSLALGVPKEFKSLFRQTSGPQINYTPQSVVVLQTDSLYIIIIQQ